MAAKSEVISVTFERGDAASCKIACLQKTVAEAGYGSPFGTYQIVFGMHFAKRNVTDSAMLVKPGEILSYDTETKEIVFTASSGDQMIYSCTQKVLTHDLKTACPTLKTATSDIACPACNEKSVNIAPSKNTFAAPVAADTTSTTVSTLISLTDTVSDALSSSCLLTLVAKSGTPVTLDVKQKMKFFKNVDIKHKAKRKKEWKVVLTALSWAFYHGPAQTNNLAQSLLCESNLSKYKVERSDTNSHIYRLSSDKMPGRDVIIEILKKEKGKERRRIDYYDDGVIITTYFKCCPPNKEKKKKDKLRPEKPGTKPSLQARLFLLPQIVMRVQ